MMKKVLFLILILSIYGCKNYIEEENMDEIPEKIFNYDLVLTDQLEVDMFAKEKYTVINGNVIIKNNSENTNPITNLDSLYSIREINKSLKIENTHISILTGLKNLKFVSENIEILNNPKLHAINSLGSFSEAKNLIIQCDIRKINISHITKLEKLEINQCDLNNYFYNENLLEINFNNLLEINDLTILRKNFKINFGALEKIYGTLKLNGNDSLENSFSNLLKCGKIEIYNNQDIINFETLQNMSDIESLSIHNCENLTSLEGLNNIVSNSLQAVHLKNLVNLTSINALKDQSAIKNILIQNTKLEDLKAFNNLKENISFLSIRDNNDLNSLLGLNNVQEINRLTIDNNNSISNLNGLTNLTSVNEQLDIIDNDVLDNLTGIDQLLEVESINIDNNRNLKNINTLKSVVFKKNIIIKGNILSDNINLNGVIDVDKIEIEGNYLLEKIELANLETVGFFIIHLNKSLKEINELDSLGTVKYFLRITYNQQLADLCSFKNLFSNPTNYNYHIDFNKNPYNSPDEVLAECQ